MQVDQLSSYLSQLMHTQNTEATSKTTANSQNSQSSVNGTNETSFDDIYKEYVNTNRDSTTTGTTSYSDLIGLMGGNTSASSITSTALNSVLGTSFSTTGTASVSDDDERTPLQVAQDAYAEFLSLASNAVSGSTGNEDNILDNDSTTNDSISKLSEAINSLSSTLGETNK